ncbi:MAG: SagB/ThcOx family dehydrogenase [Dehalococcoidales bacterium]|nr:SagB/ThcOx family dehydrogenase [Dehalococcoidales bacterium]
MKKKIGILTLAGILAICGCSSFSCNSGNGASSQDGLSPSSSLISLPAPVTTGNVSLEECIEKRRSERQYSPSPLPLTAVSQLLWAAQGITGDGKGRSAPSAGALYPLEIYLAAGRVSGLSAGVYRYKPHEHALAPVRDKNIMNDLCSAALDQDAVKNGAINLIITAVYERSKIKYGERGVRYAILEAGHVAQNFCLQAVSLGLATVTIGAFDDKRVKGIAGMGSDENPLYILSAGYPE